MSCVALAAAACSDHGDSSSATTARSSRTTVSTPVRPAGPKADLSQELTGGNGVYVRIGTELPMAKGYVQHEYVAAGTATSYRSVGSMGRDGRWTFEPNATADYRTRIIVRRPASAKKFDGTVLVEWLNVTGGVDANGEYSFLKDELEREGAIWVGVSAQALGVEGGQVAIKVNVPGSEDAGKGLKHLDPARYGSLSHPGDAYSYDIFTQVARALRDGGTPLGGMTPRHLVAAGQSQSAFAMVTYINGVQPLTQAFDGFFVHSRGAPAFPIGQSADIEAALAGPPTILRTDTDVPIFDLQAETDVVGLFGSNAVRQPDTNTFRLWEVAGTAHADRFITGDTTANSVNCGVPINDGPYNVVAKAAWHHLVAWIDHGTLPPIAPRLALTTATPPALQRDANGIVEGGVRTPPVDVPTRVLSGAKGPSQDVICLLAGSTLSISPAQLTQWYGTRQAFQRRYDAAIDRAVKAGSLLNADRQAIQGYAHPELVPG